MDKIDEILAKPELQSRVDWFWYANNDGYCGYSDIIQWLTELKPLLKTEEEQKILDNYKSMWREDE